MTTFHGRPYLLEDTVDGGDVVVPAGKLGIGDPTQAFELIPIELEVAPGSYPTLIHLVGHPDLGASCGAAELILDASAKPTTWERLDDRAIRADEEDAEILEFGDFGYRVENGIGSFGAPAAMLDDGMFDALEAVWTYSSGPEHQRLDLGNAGTIVIFAVAPQHQLCRTWLGRAADGRPVRVLTDLGLLRLDPERFPDEPLRSVPER